nr:uncharacterized protein LOC128701959 [Cherax quadricarinatus]
MSLALPTLLTYKDRSLDTTLIYKDATLPEDLLWDPGYTQPLTRLSFYFNHLDLPLVSCQERFICELAADPSTFSPFDQLFLKELRHVYGPVTSSADSLMWRYMSAARQGFASPIQTCKAAFPTCPLAANQVLDMSVLKVWKFITTKFNVNLY